MKRARCGARDQEGLDLVWRPRVLALESERVLILTLLTGAEGGFLILSHL